MSNTADFSVEDEHYLSVVLGEPKMTMDEVGADIDEHGHIPVTPETATQDPFSTKGSLANALDELEGEIEGTTDTPQSGLIEPDADGIPPNEPMIQQDSAVSVKDSLSDALDAIVMDANPSDYTEEKDPMPRAKAPNLPTSLGGDDDKPDENGLVYFTVTFTVDPAKYISTNYRPLPQNGKPFAQKKPIERVQKASGETDETDVEIVDVEMDEKPPAKGKDIPAKSGKETEDSAPESVAFDYATYIDGSSFMCFDEAASIDYTKIAMDITPRRPVTRENCQTTFAQCRAQNPLFCRFHGPKLLETDIRTQLGRFVGRGCSVSVTKDRNSNNPMTFRLTIGCPPRLKDQVMNMVRLYLTQQPGISAEDPDMQSLGNRNGKEELTQKFDMDILEADNPPPRAHNNLATASIYRRDEAVNAGREMPVVGETPRRIERAANGELPTSATSALAQEPSREPAIDPNRPLGEQLEEAPPTEQPQNQSAEPQPAPPLQASHTPLPPGVTAEMLDAAETALSNSLDWNSEDILGVLSGESYDGEMNQQRRDDARMILENIPDADTPLRGYLQGILNGYDIPAQLAANNEQLADMRREREIDPIAEVNRQDLNNFLGLDGEEEQQQAEQQESNDNPTEQDIRDIADRLNGWGGMGSQEIALAIRRRLDGQTPIAQGEVDQLAAQFGESNSVVRALRNVLANGTAQHTSQNTSAQVDPSAPRISNITNAPLPTQDELHFQPPDAHITEEELARIRAENEAFWNEAVNDETPQMNALTGILSAINRFTETIDKTTASDALGIDADSIMKSPEELKSGRFDFTASNPGFDHGCNCWKAVAAALCRLRGFNVIARHKEEASPVFAGTAAEEGQQIPTFNVTQAAYAKAYERVNGSTIDETMANVRRITNGETKDGISTPPYPDGTYISMWNGGHCTGAVLMKGKWITIDPWSGRGRSIENGAKAGDEQINELLRWRMFQPPPVESILAKVERYRERKAENPRFKYNVNSEGQMREKSTVFAFMKMQRDMRASNPNVSDREVAEKVRISKALLDAEGSYVIRPDQPLIKEIFGMAKLTH